jgi:hypothetical protein
MSFPREQEKVKPRVGVTEEQNSNFGLLSQLNFLILSLIIMSKTHKR